MLTRKSRKSEFLKWFGPILEALRALGGSAKPKEISQWIGQKYNLPDDVLNARYKKSNILKFQNQLAWARQYLVWEELLASSKRGIWTLSNKGWEASIDENKAHEIFLKWIKVFQNIRGEKSSDTNIDAEAKMVIQLQEEIEPDTHKENVKPNLLKVLQNLSPSGFEHLCGRLLREYDFENIEITQRSHDGGIDGYATLKFNPFVNMSVFFQCKRYTGTVPTEKVQAFIGVMETNRRSVEKGLIITTGSFAKAAWDIEKSNVRLELIDGDQLVEMFEKVELGVTPKTIYEPNLAFFDQYIEKKGLNN